MHLAGLGIASPKFDRLGSEIDERESFSVSRGMRIAQLVIAPVAHARLREVGRLDLTPRGDGGFGSTGGAIKDGNK